jgi:DNA-binding NtrC family response regulator
MENKKERIIFVEDDRVDQMAFERFARESDFPYDYIMTGSVSEAKKILKSEKVDAAVLDYLLGDGTALDLFGELKEIPIVIVTGLGDEETAVKAMKAGASDYLIKDPSSKKRLRNVRG